MSGLTREGTAEPVSRDQTRRCGRRQGNKHFACSADHDQDCQPYPVDPHSAESADYISICTYSRQCCTAALRGTQRVRLRQAAPSPPQLPDALHRLAKEQSHRPLDFLSGRAHETGSDSIEAIMRRRWILFAGFVARMEDTRLPKCVMFGELLVGDADCKSNGWGVSWTTSELRHQRQPVKTAAQDEGGWRKTAGRGEERFMAK